jgi:hypothetical protein
MSPEPRLPQAEERTRLTCPVLIRSFHRTTLGCQQRFSRFSTELEGVGPIAG